MDDIFRGVVIYSLRQGEIKTRETKPYNTEAKAKAQATYIVNQILPHRRHIIDKYVEKAIVWKKTS